MNRESSFFVSQVTMALNAPRKSRPPTGFNVDKSLWLNGATLTSFLIELFVHKCNFIACFDSVAYQSLLGRQCDVLAIKTFLFKIASVLLSMTPNALELQILFPIRPPFPERNFVVCLQGR
jgi:hypothetical protein